MTTPRQRTSGSPPDVQASPKTRLQRWLDANGFKAVQLERATAMSRQTLTQIRGGRDVRRKTMLRILSGCRSLSGEEVRMDEIFDLEPGGSEESK